MGVSIGELAAGITLDTSRFEKGLVATRAEISAAGRTVAAAQSPLENYAQAIDKLDNQLRKGLISQTTYNRAVANAETAYHGVTPAAGGFAGMLGKITPTIDVANLAMKAFGAATRLARDAVREFSEQARDIDRIGENAAAIGVASDFLSGIEYAAERSGVSIETLHAGLKKFTIAVGSGSKGFAAIGLAVGDLQRMKPEDAFLKTVDALNKIESPTERAAAAFKIFGKSAIEMQGLILAGVGEIEEKMERASRLNLIVSDADAAAVSDMVDAVDDIQSAWTGVARTFVSELAPVVTRIADDMGRMLESGDSAQESARVAAVITEQNWENAKTAGNLFSKWLDMQADLWGGLGGNKFLNFGGIGDEFEGKNWTQGGGVDMDGVKEVVDTAAVAEGVAEDLSKAVQDVADKVATPGEKLQKELDYLADLFDKTGMDVDLYNRAIEKAQADFSKDSGATAAAEKAQGVRDKLSENMRKAEEKIEDEKLKAAEKQAADFQKIYEASRTPAQELEDILVDLETKLAAGLDKGVFDAAKGKAFDEFRKGELDENKVEQEKFAGAVMAGSAEAYSAILKAGAQNQQIAEQLRQGKVLDQIEKGIAKAAETKAKNVTSFTP